MIRSIVFVLFIIGLTSNASAQFSGYMGKKNLVSIQATGSFRALSSIDHPFGIYDGNSRDIVQYDKNNRAKYKTKVARYDLRLAYSRLLTRKFGVGVEFSYEHLKLPVYLNYQNGVPYTSELVVESSPQFNVFGGFVVFDLYSSSKIPPLGFKCSLGIGPRFYTFDYSENYRVTRTIEAANPFPKYKSNMMGMGAFLELSTRRIITSFLAFDIGMRVNFGGVFRRGILLDTGKVSSETVWGDVSYEVGADLPMYTKSRTKDDLNTEVMGNLLSGKIGFTFIL